METCACPGCDHPGTNKCSACKTTLYCGQICQTADWAQHKEECPGHLRKIGMANLAKAEGFNAANNWPQALRYSDIAAKKLKQLKDRPVEDIDAALNYKFNALNMMNRQREALECAKEWYCMYLTKHTHPPAIIAGFALIESCIHNGEFFDALLYARTSWETITLSRDSHIPDNQRQEFIAKGAHYLAKALHALAHSGGMPEKEKQATGVEAIMLARRALEIHTQLHGAESEEVAEDMNVLASLLDYFNDVDDDEVLRFRVQAKAIFARIQGSLSVNVAAQERNLGAEFDKRARRACAAHDLDREVANYELALPRFREAARIFRAINHVEHAEGTARIIAMVEERLRQVMLISAKATRG